jgi:hypothetical protein
MAVLHTAASWHTETTMCSLDSADNHDIGSSLSLHEALTTDTLAAHTRMVSIATSCMLPSGLKD